MNYYERHLGDYARDTGHLSPLEHGVYNLLLDRYYASEMPIPADQAHRICRARTREEREAVDTVLNEFFQLEDGVYKQGRVEGEIDRARARIDSARSNGKRGGRPKKNPAGYESETQQKPNGFPVGSETETGLKALQTPDSIHQKDQTLLSSAKPTTDLLGGHQPPADLGARRAERLATVTDNAIAEYNRVLGRPVGKLPAVNPKVGRKKRQEQVRRMLQVASEICDDQFGDKKITPEFWESYFAACDAYPFMRGDGPYTGAHANWRPSFDYLTRPDTVLKVFERATQEDAA